MDELRHLVVDVNRDGQPRQGFELGRIYAGLRGVVPIFSFSDPEKQVGALEVGTSFSTLIDSISTAIGSDVAILIRDERVDDAVWQATQCLQIWGASCRSRPETMMLLAAMAVRSSRF
ncbi:hypothetical protein FE848_16220 [Marinobacter sp. 1-3A]|uniref:cache domain-containing protein n=1 Tax=Marinobacter sp. 1-3A TaxID=2582920 RepID=UPI001904EFF5|nr:cache domain-containing protein [Marinobacter sp. 1-3A]MBK1874772.1 hypothetical protein [Marinobacter sp. 1-3A]